MRVFLMSVLSVATLSACATSYDNSSLLGGQRTTWLEEDTLRIKANHNGFVTGKEGFEMLLLLAAEKGREKGYKYYTIEDFDGQVGTKIGGGLLASLLDEAGVKTSSPLGGYSDNGTHPVFDATIMMYPDRPSATEEVVIYDVEEMFVKYAPKYKKKDK